jgi:hypothetical protein
VRVRQLTDRSLVAATPDQENEIND